MFKIDKFSFDCDQCKQLLIDPVSTPCGKFICKSHLDTFMKNTANERNTFVCEMCKEEHPLPHEGPIFEECQKEIEKARESVAKVELLEKNSEGYIKEYFEDIKRQVVLRTEGLKIKIDQYSDNIIKTVDKTQENCIKLSKEENQITVNIAKSKTELDKLIKQFDSIEANAMEFKEVKKGVTSLNQEFYQIIDEYNNLLIGNKKYLFQFNELSIDDIFGRLSDSEIDGLDSIILDEKNKVEIRRLCELPETKWKLQYRASRDGFTAKNFHDKCNGIRSTLTVIKSTNGNIFGGFTEKAWRSVGPWYPDPNAFVYSLINKEDRLFKVICSNKRAIFCDARFGPSFGGGHDISIASDSNCNEESYSNLGFSYQHPDYKVLTQKAYNVLAGSRNFQTLEIEVFTIQGY